jgi:tripartite-type tricarboxylate transporter receptor subunit TctC
MELFKSMAGIDMVHIPYKGSAPAITDLLGGHVDVMFDNMPAVMPHVKAGKLRALGVSSAKRSALAPDLPTVAEGGVPGFEVRVWYGVVVPAGTSKEIVKKLNGEINRILALPDRKAAVCRSWRRGNRWYTRAVRRAYQGGNGEMG